MNKELNNLNNSAEDQLLKQSEMYDKKIKK